MKLLKKILRILLKTIVILIILAIVGLWTARFIVWRENINVYYHQIELDDGPYLFWDDESTIRVMHVHFQPLEKVPSGVLGVLRVAWSQELPADYQVSEFTIDLSDLAAARQQIADLGIAFDPAWRHKPSGGIFDAQRIAAMGDVHGNYNHLVLLLQNAGIVDSDLDWTWGEGHLVFVGDVFDKGPGVTESLWLIYKLEKQALAAGGKVHYLLGNHELMVLRGGSERRFRGRKYSNIERELGTSYSDFYGPDSELGRWLRTKNTVVKINDKLFVHGGISEEVVDKHLTIDALNAYGRRLVESEDVGRVDGRDKENLELLESFWGPYEYRGMIGFRGTVGGVASKFSDKTDDLSMNVRSAEIMEKILDFYDCSQVVVGHSQVGTIQTLRENTVVAINMRLPRSDVVEEDSNAQMLVIEGDALYRVRIRGNRELL